MSYRIDHLTSRSFRVFFNKTDGLLITGKTSDATGNSRERWKFSENTQRYPGIIPVSSDYLNIPCYFVLHARQSHLSCL
ncbi:hypothetical protein B5X24_HaOG211621 [Helicoverpa armigera]|uniref:Uncharacterized protein n=1 Tax=Helicoverpa armigera TaxID=29058 RepID=A0A2W1BB87_HELAM|nr:hypothetical protein B5X24_HaOG211621 [Helicoverpa armigera]